MAVRLAIITDGGAMLDESSSTPAVRGPLAASPYRFRFTIGGMLTITSFAAILVAGLFAFPPVVSAAIAGLMSVCIPAMLAGCLIYGGSAWRAFAIGMLLPSALRLASGLFGGMLGGISVRMMSQQQAMQQYAIKMSRLQMSQPTSDSSAFEYMGQLAVTWDRLGYAYMTDETLFWAGSAVAGLATLFVQRHFARVAHATTKRIGLHAS
jgi:hypothetical protein